MKYLLDVNVLLAAVWANHPQFAAADAWLNGKSVEKFLSETNATRIPDDLPALESHAENSEQVTDRYLAALAGRHGYKLATFDGGIKHSAIQLIEPAEADGGDA